MLTLRVLGELEVELGGRLLEPPASRRAWLLLGWLALRPGLHPRAEVAARFWPDVLDQSARASLRSTVWALRRALGEDGSAWLLSTRERIGLDPARGLSVDAQAFEALVTAGRAEEALALCRGELLAGFDADWVLGERQAHQARVAGLHREVANAAAADGDHREALRVARAEAALDPFSEDAHAHLLRRLAATGDRAVALAEHRRFAERLRRELGVAPAPALRDAVAELRAPAATADSAPATSARPAASTGSAPSPAPRRPAEPLPLIARTSERDALLSAWGRAADGAGCAALVTGDPGIGKSRLIAELARLAAADGALTAVAAAPELGGETPGALWVEVLRELAGALPPPPGEAAWAAALAELSPALERRFGPAGRTSFTGSPELARARLFEAMVALLEWATAGTPLLVVVEDVHLADPLSLELLAHVARSLGTLPAMLVLTRRAAPRRPELDGLEQSLRARGAFAVELVLAPLKRAEVEELARAVAPLDASQLERVATAAEGNPLLAVETARALARGELTVPSGVRGTVRATLATVAPDARLVLELIAVAGRDVTEAELAEMPVAVRDGAAVGALGRAFDCGLLRDHGERTGFRHALLREAVYADLPDHQRRWLHHRLAVSLAAEPSAGSAAEVAHHLRAAGRDDDAVAHLVRAAHDSGAVGGLEQATVFLQTAASIAPGERELWLELGDLESQRGRVEPMELAWTRALELLAPDDPLARARAWLRRAHWHHGNVCHPAEVARSARTALGLLDGAALSAPRERVDALVEAAWAEAFVADPSGAEALIARAEQLAGGRADDELACQLGRARASVLARRGRTSEARAAALEAAGAARRAGRAEHEISTLIEATNAAAAGGDFEGALTHIEAAAEVCRESFAPPLLLITLSIRSWLLVRLGRVADARGTVAAELLLAERLGLPKYRGIAAFDAGHVALASGDHEVAAGRFADALAESESVPRPLARLARAEALALWGRLGEAEQELRATVLEPVRAVDFPDTLVPRMARVQGLIARARGDHALAQRRLEEAAAAWTRQLGRFDAHTGNIAAMVDLGRPVLGLVEPGHELARVAAELLSLTATA